MAGFRKEFAQLLLKIVVMKLNFKYGAFVKLNMFVMTFKKKYLMCYLCLLLAKCTSISTSCIYNNIYIGIWWKLFRMRSSTSNQHIYKICNCRKAELYWIEKFTLSLHKIWNSSEIQTFWYQNKSILFRLKIGKSKIQKWL